MTARPALAAIAALALAGLAADAARAQSPSVEITIEGDRRCITSNAVPNHDIGTFPNRGNPHSFRSQQLRYCVDATPSRNGRPNRSAQTVGIGLNGIPFRPGTADWYDASSPRGHSRDRSSGWNLEGMGSADTLGMDHHNAHVDERGLYHYHGVPVGLLAVSSSSHIGYAADGFEIHYVGAEARPSYVLRSGTRPTAPGGRHDGTYVEDWEYRAGAGNLDECNGGIVDGTYVYFATDTYPFYPRCHWGDIGRDFRGGGPLPDTTGRPPPGRRPPRR